MLTEFGTFNGEIALPEDVQLGQATINATLDGRYAAQVSFSIAEFRVPEYKVEVTPTTTRSPRAIRSLR